MLLVSLPADFTTVLLKANITNVVEGSNKSGVLIDKTGDSLAKTRQIG